MPVNTLDPAQTTLMSIAGIDFSLYSTRGITMTLTPIPAAAQLRRTCRGTLIDISLSQFQKYRASITCTDFEAPTFTDIWPGKLVVVQFVPEVGVIDSGHVVTLTMRVVSWQTSREEWQTRTAWQLDLEEV